MALAVGWQPLEEFLHRYAHWDQKERFCLGSSRGTVRAPLATRQRRRASRRLLRFDGVRETRRRRHSLFFGRRIFGLLVSYIPLARNVNSTRVWLTAEVKSLELGFRQCFVLSQSSAVGLQRRNTCNPAHSQRHRIKSCRAAKKGVQ